MRSGAMLEQLERVDLESIPCKTNLTTYYNLQNRHSETTHSETLGAG